MKELMKNSLYFGDNLEILKDLYQKHPEGFIDLIYIDPPFNSNKDYNILFENIDLKDTKAQREAFKDTWSNVTYIDTLNELKSLDLNLPDFLQNLDKIGISQGAVSYLTIMAIRMWYMKKLLKETGSFYLHCDSTMSHYLKLLCDLIFGESYFKNEIIWSNETSSGYKSQVKYKFVRGHDTILYYSMKNSAFNIHYLPLSQSTINRYDKIDSNGDKYKIYFEKDGSERKVYLKNSKGRKLTDTWTDLPSFQTVNANREWIGYPTQKPLVLMERIIETSSNEGDIVADFFCGCGTTIVAAQKLERNWLGVDISHLAVKLITKRLIDTHGQEVRKTFELFGFPKDLASARMLATETKAGRFKFEEWVIEVMFGGVLNQNKNQTGFDGYLTFDAHGDKDVCFIEVKSGGANLTQLHYFIQIVDDREAEMGVFVCFKEQVTLGMEKAAKLQGHYFSDSMDKIQILTVEDLLEHKGIHMPSSTVGTFKSAKKAEQKANQENIGF